MSTNTQEQGRSFYTERDFAFTPSAYAKDDIYRTEYEWERGLIAATRVGDPTYDADAKGKLLAADPAAPAPAEPAGE